RPGIPPPTQPATRLLPGMRGAPFSLVPVDIPADLRRPRRERPRIPRQLADLPTRRIHRVPMSSQHGAELRVTDHRGMPDPVDRIQAVAHPHRVDPPPPTP